MTYADNTIRHVSYVTNLVSSTKQVEDLRYATELNVHFAEPSVQCARRGILFCLPQCGAHSLQLQFQSFVESHQRSESITHVAVASGDDLVDSLLVLVQKTYRPDA